MRYPSIAYGCEAEESEKDPGRHLAHSSRSYRILVPGSLGFISLVTLVSRSYSTAVANAILLVMTLVAISLGLLVGAAVVEPLKSVKDESDIQQNM